MSTVSLEASFRQMLCGLPAPTTLTHVTNLSPVPAPRAPADHSLRDALRAVRTLFGDGAFAAAQPGPPLERLAMRSDPPHVSPCTLLEPADIRAISVPDTPLVAAFLDGVQRSRVLAYAAGSPIIYATVAAAIRERRTRRLETWGAPSVRQTVFASRAKLGEVMWNQLVDSGIPVVDITAEMRSDAVPDHPFALRARALDLVSLEREGLERRLAAEWCRQESRWLWIDGGISGNLVLDEQSTAFGVVKSHTTLYGTSAQVMATLGLNEGERSPVFLVGHQPRRAVASWYLRLRTAAGGDPLHGLVRVEVAPPTALASGDPLPPAALDFFTAYCDRISAGILAERAPLSLPDPRWDTLTYGIHACEMYLDALVGS
jgi:hypothetical protein